MTAGGDLPLRIFRELHTGLPREAPGSREATARALGALAPLPPAPEVLDIGCGPGMQTAHLAELLPDATLTAVDAHAPYLERARERLASARNLDRVTLVEGDMRSLPFDNGSFDLLWCEGAAYIMGVEMALGTWKRFLREGGGVGFTEAVWRRSDPPQELERWWQEGYPDMGDIDECLERVHRAGFEVVSSFVLPDSAWWDDYYGPMEERLGVLRTRYRADQEALALLETFGREIEYFRRWSDCYGYLFVSASLASGI